MTEDPFLVNIMVPIEAGNAPLPFDLSGIRLDAGRGLATQLYEHLRDRMLDGRLGAGVRLPASRELSEQLGISRNTVVRALDQLYAEGYVTGRVGDGTYVASTVGKPRQNTMAEASAVLQEELAPRLIDNRMPLPPSGPPRAFRVGVPAFDLFPFETWARLQARFWRKPSPARLGYGDPAGDRQLRELIAIYLRNGRGLHCDASQIVITSGAQQGISLCARLLLSPGDKVAVEDPGYRAAGRAFGAAGGWLIGIPLDEEGLRVDRLKAEEGCRLAYVTPSHQYPTGVTLSLARRLEMLDWAVANAGWIVEDDYDGEYRYSGTPLAPLAALDTHGRVIYVGTFCKIAFPALRLGYVVLPPALADAFAQQRALDMRGSDIGTQAVMAEFIADGHFQRHVRRMRKAARARLEALQAHWPESVEGCSALPDVKAGLHLCVRVENAERERDLFERAESVGVEMSRLSDYWIDPSKAEPEKRAGLVLGFAAVPEMEIVEALKRLREVWKG
ncbi:MocR-like pyridoxine biosynthesis transcription factor PdxR [Pseudomonas matsuisoli]|uniref:Transcriptional regulator n=1 Tax=Pseudomonas matsuisoli TaxID=1515666 RepID=A0A917UVX0_9PSED|nr:PLP-dependent aminotransferase family protein [Pseudomonas matsuisoli]GGJ89062.1 transcriptional regulator [Pseudomonas matsuisoli]